MQKISLVERLIKFMKANSEVWIPGGELERIALSVGYKASNISRRARELVEDGTLDRRENSKGHVEYKWHKVEKIISSYERVGNKMVEVKQMTLV